VKKPFLLRPFLFFFLSIFVFSSCKKVNEATLLGGGLVPEVDNINTFDTLFETTTDNVLLDDTTRLAYGDPVALGNIISDPEFGQTNAAVYFQVAPVSYKTYPFSAPKDSVLIDSVVLSLDYMAGYGDFTTPQTVRVYEVAQTSAFNDVTAYPFKQPPFETTGAELGTKTFAISQLKDSLEIRRKDTTKVGNQLRIRLDDAVGERFKAYDATNGANGAYYNDTLFKNLFRGLAIKADEGSGNGLAYFDLTNTSKTRLTIYYRYIKNGAVDTAETAFIHTRRLVDSNTISTGGLANCIKRQPAGGWSDYLNNGQLKDEKLYIQSTPGSVGHIIIPGLENFDNKLVHRAELIVHRISSPLDNGFAAPAQLFLDKIKTGNGKDSAFIFHEYLAAPVSATSGFRFDFASFGGHLRADDTYRFNVTTAVQDILTRDSSNYQLRIYAPFKTAPLDARIQPAVPRPFQILQYPAYGRVVLAGGNHTDPALRLRLRVVYSIL
jgi:hypothetical protein